MANGDFFLTPESVQEQFGRDPRSAVAQRLLAQGAQQIQRGQDPIAFGIQSLGASLLGGLTQRELQQEKQQASNLVSDIQSRAQSALLQGDREGATKILQESQFTRPQAQALSQEALGRREKLSDIESQREFLRSLKREELAAAERRAKIMADAQRAANLQMQGLSNGLVDVDTLKKENAKKLVALNTEAGGAQQAAELSRKFVEEAIELNKQAFTGVGAKEQALLFARSDDPTLRAKAIATTKLNTLLQSGVLSNLKQIFGASFTETEGAKLDELVKGMTGSTGEQQAAAIQGFGDFVQGKSTQKQGELDNFIPTLADPLALSKKGRKEVAEKEQVIAEEQVRESVFDPNTQAIQQEQAAAQVTEPGARIAVNPQTGERIRVFPDGRVEAL